MEEKVVKVIKANMTTYGKQYIPHERAHYLRMMGAQQILGTNIFHTRHYVPILYI